MKKLPMILLLIAPGTTIAICYLLDLDLMPGLVIQRSMALIQLGASCFLIRCGIYVLMCWGRIASSSLTSDCRSGQVRNRSVLSWYPFIVLGVSLRGSHSSLNSSNVSFANIKKPPFPGVRKKVVLQKCSSAALQKAQFATRQFCNAKIYKKVRNAQENT